MSSIVTFAPKSTNRPRQTKHVRVGYVRLGITGRDGYIIAQALAYAVEAIAALPDKWLERSNLEDMKCILAATTDEWTAQHLREGACRHLFHPGSPLVRNTAIDLPEDDSAA
jgi:hypothetical protein